MLDERRALQKRLDEILRDGGGAGNQLELLLTAAERSNGVRIVAGQVSAGNLKELQSMGDALRERLGTGVGVLASAFGDGKNTILVVVTDDLRERGLRADRLVAILLMLQSRGQVTAAEVGGTIGRLAGEMAKLFSCPSTSVNQRRINRTARSSTVLNT